MYFQNMILHYVIRFYIIWICISSFLKLKYGWNMRVVFKSEINKKNILIHFCKGLITILFQVIKPDQDIIIWKASFLQCKLT